MALTFGDVKNLVFEYAGKGGKCPDSRQTELFARQVLEHLLFSGQYGAIRKFCFIAQRGLVTAPPELETPLKVRIDSQVGTVWSKWFSYHSVAAEIDGCVPAEKVLMEEPNYVCTAFPVPKGGSLLGVLGTCDEDETARITFQGKDTTGREVITMAEGEQITGEMFKIQKGKLLYGKVRFGEITGVVKSHTNGYVQAYAVDPDLRAQQFIGDYSPLEEKPLYRQFLIRDKRCDALAHVSILARIRLKENYHENDIVPFENTLPITIAAQRLFAESVNDLQTVQSKKASLKEFIEDENSYKKPAGTNPVEVFFPLSGGAVKNIV